LIKSGTQFALVVTDANTGSTLARHSLQSGATSSVLGMLEELTRRFGSPREIRTDHGTTFASSAFEELPHQLGIQHRVVPPRILRAANTRTTNIGG
jgi:hypothetical protein